MTTYLVAWPDLTSSFISAHDEGELRRLLSLRADPQACRWRRLSARLWVDLVDDDAGAGDQPVRGRLPPDGTLTRRWRMDRVVEHGEA